MFSKTKYDYNLSSKLSQVMDDIGVNKKLVMRRRHTFMLNETILTLMNVLRGDDVNTYFLGSQSEGSVTKGLQSDCDILQCFNEVNVIQDIGDLKNGKRNILMVKDNNTTKGYCYLLPIISSQAKTGAGNDFKYTKKFLLKNTNHHDFVKNTFLQGVVIHGPAVSSQQVYRKETIDTVLAFPCFSWPHSAWDWLDRQGRWPTQEMKKECVRNGFFLVPVGSKISIDPEIEWRISTSIAERCLMTSLNITQLRCYVLLKMIAKTYFFSNGDTKISSYMCKTTLFYCVERSEPEIWREDNLYICVFVCLLQLRFFLSCQKCPHFIINENNLMAGQFTGEEQRDLLCTLNNLVHTYGLGLLGIHIDLLGDRLKIKLENISEIIDLCLQGLKEISEYMECSNLNIGVFSIFAQIYKYLPMENRETLTTYILKLNRISEKGSELERKACTFFLPEIYATLGSILASSNIEQSFPFSHMELTYFKYPDSTVSTTLKLASVYYCSEHLKECGDILRHIESDVEFERTALIHPVCECYLHPLKASEKLRALCYKDITETQPYIGYCVRFHKSEFNCIPHELQYEMFRSSKDDRQHRDKRDEMWMDLSVVDSLPFLYFLQYKVNRHQQKIIEECLALAKLITCTIDAILYHKETALNLLGQCYEDQFCYQEALQCYVSSLQVRKRNNVAVWHICKLLARIMQTK